jgi:hypothetical protein
VEADNPFVLSPSSYKRDLNILGYYVQDCASYLHQMTGAPLNDCMMFVKQEIQPGDAQKGIAPGRYAFNDPKIVYLEREDNGDRVRKEGRLSEYLTDSIRNRQLIAPTLTTYLHPDVLQSPLVDYIEANVKARGVAKKAKFKAEMEGDIVLMQIKDNEQTNKKLANNSISGAHVSPSTPLYNKTAHSTLTSNCRSTSGFGNANNEKFLSGNRHYWSPEIVMQNIISICNHTDYEAQRHAMKKFGIRHPTVEETMECIAYSTNLYWRDKFQLLRVYRLVKTLTDEQRSAFVYTGDMYHLMKYNEDVVRIYVTKLSRLVEVVHPEPDSVLKKVQEEHVHLACQICERYTKGLQLHEIVGDARGIVASTAKNIGDVGEEYRDLIRAFWVTSNVPASLAFFPDSIRRSALTSDTDSTIFTVQDWVLWHQGWLGFDEKCNAVAASMVFLAAQTIIHVLARMSANFGIVEKYIHKVAMKNEFKFDVFIPTQVAKHYFALIGCQEGNLFKDYKKEIKGVHLKASNAPRFVMKEAEKMMLFIMNSVLRGEKIKIKEILKTIGDIERQIFTAIGEGGYQFFRMGQIKPPESYAKSAEESPYQQYVMWNEVFGPKYGVAPPVPYTCVKIATDLDTPTKTKEWLDTLEDRMLAERMENYMKRMNKRYLGSVQLPEQNLQTHGIPNEILKVAGVRKIVADATKVFYIILETLGIYMQNDKLTRLVSDTH